MKTRLRSSRKDPRKCQLLELIARGGWAASMSRSISSSTGWWRQAAEVDHQRSAGAEHRGLRERGAGARAAEPSQYRDHLRHRRGERPTLYRHEFVDGQDSPRCCRRRGRSSRRRPSPSPATSRVRSSTPRSGGHPPRHQAEQHPDLEEGRGEGHRLWPGRADGDVASVDGLGVRRGHAALSVPGAARGSRSTAARTSTPWGSRFTRCCPARARTRARRSRR